MFTIPGGRKVGAALSDISGEHRTRQASEPVAPVAVGQRSQPSAAVIGGGISGLASAFFLQRSGWQVTLFESSDQFGGLGTFFEYDGHFFERFYHVILPGDDPLLSLIDEIDGEDRVYWRDSSLGFEHRGHSYPLNSPADLLRFRAVPLMDRLRLGLSALYATHLARPDQLDDTPVSDWLARISGRQAFESFWRPLLRLKFGEAIDEVPALWYWARFNREKGTQKEVKGYFRGGYHGLTELLVGTIREMGGILNASAPVERLSLNSDGKPEVQIDGTRHAFDTVVCCAPVPVLQRLAEPEDFRKWLPPEAASIDYQGVVNVVMILRTSVSEHYWQVIVDEESPFDGIVESTRVIDLTETGGNHLVYLLRYVHRSDSLFQEHPDSIRNRFVEGFLRLSPHLSSEDIKDVFLFRTPFVEPVYTLGYLRKKPPTELVPGRVYLACSAQVYPNVTSWNSSVDLARRVADQIVARESAR
jgi:protoporphyrinogen oxidase